MDEVDEFFNAYIWTIHNWNKFACPEWVADVYARAMSERLIVLQAKYPRAVRQWVTPRLEYEQDQYRFGQEVP